MVGLLPEGQVVFPKWASPRLRGVVYQEVFVNTGVRLLKWFSCTKVFGSGFGGLAPARFFFPPSGVPGEGRVPGRNDVKPLKLKP